MKLWWERERERDPSDYFWTWKLVGKWMNLWLWFFHLRFYMLSKYWLCSFLVEKRLCHIIVIYIIWEVVVTDIQEWLNLTCHYLLTLTLHIPFTIWSLEGQKLILVLNNDRRIAYFFDHYCINGGLVLLCDAQGII